MKRHYIKSLFLPAVLVTALAITGCEKNDGPIDKEILEQIDAIPAVATTIDATGSPAIDVLNPASFNGKFTVSEFFTGPGSESPAKVDVVVRKNGGTGTNVKVFQADVATFPSSFTVTAAQLEALFGATIVVGDNYDFSTDIYLKNGKKYEAFPLGGVSTSSGPTAVPGFSYSVRFGAICAYDPNIYEGDFEVISDASYSGMAGETITLTRVTASSFSFQYPSYALISPTNHNIVVNVNTGNNNAAIARTPSLGGGWAWSTSYSGPAVLTAGAITASFVAPCAKEVTLNLQHVVDAGSFGTFKMVMRKIP